MLHSTSTFFVYTAVKPVFFFKCSLTPPQTAGTISHNLSEKNARFLIAVQRATA